MNVNNTPQSQSAYGSDQGVANNGGMPGLNDMFMKLLVAQIQNQDPLNPTDGTEYVSQLAQLTQVQSMEYMSQLMANNAVLMDNLQTLSTGNLVGQKVMVQSETLNSDGKTVVDGRLTLEHPANVVTVIVKDSAGVEHKIELGAQDTGQVDFTIDPAKLGLSEGKYSLSVVTDTEESKVPIELGGTVSGVRIPLDGSSTMLNIPGVGELPYHNITQFGRTGSDKNA
ncbi:MULTISPECIES: flagellar hook assembly protein FlgD [unclassified Serratia (in: enterobacteria)]|uniref:flagellar hook assembly protein FlgD n=1 Tax=unclassified Serratia (in: enterobacteria) TaxID=2647522 RepID=UPI0005032AEC|nr:MULTISPECIES: flagellar hook assembly protein FlgD [unclassified Serratia (in: enterobacteria)]KFK95349.1 flagellar basal body rod modification protein [Serratia sp. Ag2]KFK98697.1 flagellar basal body rod modification protein [Serratia sp. Ag1]